MTKETMIGIDLVKSVFQVRGASMCEQIKFRRKLTRQRFRQFMADQVPGTVVMEACVSAHYWAREMAKLGHDVSLIAPQYVRPFVKRQKTMQQMSRRSSSPLNDRRCVSSPRRPKISKRGLFFFE